MSDIEIMKQLLEASPEKKRAVSAILTGQDPATPTPKSTRLLTIKDTAKRLDVSRSTVYKLIRTGKLRTVNAGDRRVPEQSVLDFLGI